jgi:hypothetical protein
MSSIRGKNGSSEREFTAHKLALILPRIEAVGASVIYLSPYSRLF